MTMSPTRPAGARIPPHDLAAEASLLGACLLSARACDDATMVGVRSSDFYRPAYGLIWDAISSLHSRGVPCDVITVKDQLHRDGLLDTIGGAAELIALQAGTPAISNASRYATIVTEFAQLRGLIGVSAEIAELGYSMPDDVAQTCDAAERLVANVTRHRADEVMLDMGALLAQGLDHIDALMNGTTVGVALPTHALANRIGPLLAGNVVVIGARPAMGKTVVGLQAAYEAARDGQPSLLCSLEMAAPELAQRLIALDCAANPDAPQVDITRLRNGNLSAGDWAAVDAAVGRLAELPLVTVCDFGLTVNRLRSIARRFAAKHRGARTGLVVVDYLQLMQSETRSENKQAEIAAISRGVKMLAGELQWPVIVLSQINRGVEGRLDKRPTLADLRDSGAIEQDGDIVLLLYRDEVYDPATTAKGELEIAVAKHRHGVAGGKPVIVRFDGAHAAIS